MPRVSPTLFSLSLCRSSGAMVAAHPQLHELRSGTLLAPGGGGVVLGAAAASYFSNCVRLLLSRWAALRLAVDHEWGGRDSLDPEDLAFQPDKFDLSQELVAEAKGAEGVMPPKGRNAHAT